MSDTSPLRSIPFGRPWITDVERAAVLAVLNQPILTHGPQGQAFEGEFSAFVGDGASSVAVSSGMAALHLAYLNLGIGAGDEVIVPAQTHVATVHAVELVGATPVFVDCDPATGNLTADRTRPALTQKTKAIVVVHFIGIPCAMPAIMALAEEHHLKVIEDCALAIGARYGGKHVGLFGDAGCFSFYPVKHITTGEGGMVITRDHELAKKIASFRAFGVDRSHSERKIPGMYDVLSLGLNYRMSEIEAALGRVQLSRISDILSRRRENFDALQRRLRGIPDVRVLAAEDREASTSPYCLSVFLGGALAPRRNLIVERLNTQGIGTSIYYPQPVPRLRYYQTKYGYEQSRFPHATAISDHSIALPIGPHVTVEDANFIAETFCAIIKSLSI